MKKIWSIVLALVMMLSLVPMGIFTLTANAAATSGTTGDCTWSLNGTVLTISGNGEMKSYASFGYDYCHPWGDDITKVIIEDGVVNIGGFAFEECSSLSSITIPNSITRIGYAAFQGCSNLTSITIPNSVRSVEGFAFNQCRSLTSVTIPDGVTNIEEAAFSSCDNLTSITIPSSVMSIGDSAFHNCNSLKNVYITDVAAWCNIEFGKYDSNPLKFADQLYIKNKLASVVVVPNGVKSIPKYGFSCKNLTSITIPNSVTSIGEWAFSNCSSLTSVAISSDITSINDGLFYNCNSLTSVEIPNGVTNIGGNAFSGCSSLTSVTIPNTVTNIGQWAFFGCSSLPSLSIPASVTNIGDIAFSRCSNLSSIMVDKKNPKYHSDRNCLIETASKTLIAGCRNSVIPTNGSVTSIDQYAFCDCDGLTSLVIPDCVTNIGDGAFADCTDLVSITLPAALTKIEWITFSGCMGLSSIVIPNGVSAIGWDSLSLCFSLKTVVIPSSVTRIDMAAFDGCTALTTIFYTGTKEQWEEITVGILNEPLKNAKIIYNYASPKVITNPEDASVSEDTNAKFTVAASGTGLKYQWQVKTSSSGKWNNSKTTGYNTKSITVDATAARNGYHYRCVITDTAGNTVYSNAAKLTVIKHTYSNVCDKNCNVCGATRTVGAHTYEKVVTKATLKVNGKINYKCTKCGYVSSKSTEVKRPTSFKLSTTTYTYDGKVKTPTVTVKDSAGKTLKKDTDYTVTYASGRKNVGTYKVTVKMKGNYTGTKTLTFKINPANVSKCSVKLSTTSYTYNGSTKTPTVTVKNANGVKLTKGTHYTVTYASGRKNVGTYKVTVKMKGNYTGTKTLTFKINPPTTTVSKVTSPKAKTLKITVGKKTTQTTGYQLQYSTSKSFKSVKNVYISNKTTNKTITGLKAKTTYYVRVRTYKTVNGTKYYSGWSTAKSAKTK